MKQVSKDKDNRRVAIIDIGSNTFHLMIVDLSPSTKQFQLIHRERKFVYLAKDGIDLLSEDTMDRGVANITELLDLCKLHKVDVIRAAGTAALRSADNADLFVQKIRSLHNLEIEIISGQREGELIYKGIAFSGINMTKPSLIVDIGGGSVEFIIVSNDNIVFNSSYNIGISQLRHQFKNNDPISEDDIRLIYSHLDGVISEFLNQAIEHNVEVIIGASGPFEIIESMCEVDIQRHTLTTKDVVLDIIDDVIHLPLQERKEIPLMPADRADLSVESLLIIKYLLRRIQSLQGVIISQYALREGLISEMI